MKKLDPQLILALILVIALAAFYKTSNPNKKYSTQNYWKSATVEDVKNLPNEVLLPDNKNGPVLMWAAMVTNDPKIITALVNRGANVNESDSNAQFSGTPLSAAAGFNPNPAIIDELIRLGAFVDKLVGSNEKSPLIIAAELNQEAKIIESLIKNGASTTYKDHTGRTALDAAIKFNNVSAEQILRKYQK